MGDVTGGEMICGRRSRIGRAVAEGRVLRRGVLYI